MLNYTAMRKFLIVLTVFSFVTSSLLAQDKKSHKKFHVDYGLKTGINITRFNLADLKDAAAPNITEKWRTGFVFGAFLNTPIYKKFSFQPELLYSSMGGDFLNNTGQKVRARYNFFSIPTMAKYTVGKHWAFLAGPQFDMLIQGTERSSLGKIDVSDDLKDFDILGTVGVEAWPSANTVFQARYMRGFNDVDLRANATRYYQEGVQLTFGLKLNGPKKPRTIDPELIDPADVDTDSDGIYDNKDKCPTTPGLAKYSGCPIPDTDGDGINDEMDKCPTQKGLAKYDGCPAPDTDGDGVTDEVDKCPTVPGLPFYDGCPAKDSDKDGIMDHLDKCPFEAGLAKYEGCPAPDTDGDGVNDEEDKCPTVAGSKENGGCPGVTEEQKQRIDYAAKNIYFATGSNKLDKRSFAGLDEVATIMNEHKDIKLSIEGHTDNTGVAAKNQTLSENRAAAVKAYLVSKGVDADRLTSAGYGQDNPVDTNKTAAGRAKNRRVELKINY